MILLPLPVKFWDIGVHTTVPGFIRRLWMVLVLSMVLKAVEQRHWPYRELVSESTEIKRKYMTAPRSAGGESLLSICGRA